MSPVAAIGLTSRSTGVGNLCFSSCFCIRQLRPGNFTSLLFQTSSASIEKGSLVPKFVERERGFTNLVLLHDAAIDILDQDNSQPSAPKIWSIFRSHVHHSRIHFITSHLSHLQLAYRPVRYNP